MMINDEWNFMWYFVTSISGLLGVRLVPVPPPWGLLRALGGGTELEGPESVPGTHTPGSWRLPGLGGYDSSCCRSSAVASTPPPRPPHSLLGLSTRQSAGRPSRGGSQHVTVQSSSRCLPRACWGGNTCRTHSPTQAWPSTCHPRPVQLMSSAKAESISAAKKLVARAKKSAGSD